VLGGVVTRAAAGEHGFTAVDSTSDVVPAGPWMEFHSDTFTVPPDARELARTPAAVQAFVCGPHLGLQFHPEIDPGSFAAWRESWALTGVDAEIVAAGVPVEQIAAEIEARADEAAARCAALVREFLSLSARPVEV
jgi:GMP synthase-like glutamine amidotransferase